MDIVNEHEGRYRLKLERLGLTLPRHRYRARERIEVQGLNILMIGL